MQLFIRKCLDLNNEPIISNKEMNDIMKIIKSLEESWLLIKKQKNKKEDFLECY